MSRYYFVNDAIVLNRKEFERFLLDYIKEQGIKVGDYPHLLVITTIERNVEHHPLRIARDLGFDVETRLIKG